MKPPKLANTSQPILLKPLEERIKALKESFGQTEKVRASQLARLRGAACGTVDAGMLSVLMENLAGNSGEAVRDYIRRAFGLHTLQLH